MKNAFFFLLMLPTFLAAQVNFTDSDLPIIVINTPNNQPIEDEERIVADMGIINNGVGNRNYLIDPYNDYDGKISIEIRGSTSQQYPKKSYGLETQDEAGNNNNVTLLGLPTENDWILYAPYPDKTMIRNALTYHLARRMGHYASRTRYCELVINNSYKGIYVLEEKIKRDNDRVDIATLNFEDISGDELTGGYIIKIDKTTGDGNQSWISNFSNKVFFQYHDPSEEELHPAQKNYIQTYVHDFEAALEGANFEDPIDGFRKYIDEVSFMDFFLLQELGRTVDGYRSSTFLHKDRDSKGGKLTMGPMWDFNLSYGNADYCDGFELSGWQYEFNDVCSWANPEVPFWWARLLQDTSYANQLQCRWQDLREGVLHTDSLHSFVDSIALKLEEARVRNFTQWPIIGEYINWNYFVGETYEEEIDYLKEWLMNRTTWMDEHLPGTCWPPTSVNNKTVAISEPILKVFPNPTFGNIHIEVENLNTIETLQVFDILGKKILPTQYELFVKDAILNLSNLSPGIYFLRVVVGGKQQTVRVVLL